MKKLPNIYPGEVLLTEFLEPLGISQNALALRPMFSTKHQRDRAW
jgi:plasmid maintenance system antidote protein VapI